MTRRNFLAACIEDAGFVVETAKDGIDALEKVEANPPDLMTLDMVMPRKSGIAVIRSLREQERFAKLPVIVITAKAQNVDKVLGEKIARVQAYITKPFSPTELLDTIDKFL